MNSDGESSYSLEIVSRLSGVQTEHIMHYREQGWIRPLPGSEDRFDDETLRTLRRIDHLRSTCGVNDQGLRLILSLLDELEHLRTIHRSR